MQNINCPYFNFITFSQKVCNLLLTYLVFFCLKDAVLHGLKAQKLIAQGNTLGMDYVMEYAPCKGKSA